MTGILVLHEEYGEGQVLPGGTASLTVRFFERGITHQFGLDAIKRGFLRRLLLESGRCCLSPRGQCLVRYIVPDSRELLRRYEVQYENGELAICTEGELQPNPAIETPRPSSRLANRNLDSLSAFSSREAVRYAQLSNLRQGGRLMALLSARIDLHPHQAFVVGTVLDDRRRRYILADEVGLGKTVEAGVVIHDLLSGNSAARVLVVCPGTLTQQWLCEIYSKFGGHVFTLLDLHSESNVNWSSLSHVIVSMTEVLRYAAPDLAKIEWDLLVVDECHHLLAVPQLYGFVQELTRSTPSVLLLSAIPAQQREDEFLRLLALLEPDRFNPNDPDSVKQFQELYKGQPQISRRLQPLVIRLRGLQTGEYNAEDVVRQVNRLVELPLLSEDKKLRHLATSMDALSDQVERDATRLVDYVSDRYRVHRRILRNRRQTLVRDGKLESVQRRCEIYRYEPKPLEKGVLDAVDYLLMHASEDALESSVRNALARLAWQSLSSSSCALELLAPILGVCPEKINDRGRDFLALGHLTGYNDWEMYQDLLHIAAAGLLQRDLLRDAVGALQRWKDSPERNTRFQYLLTVLGSLWKQDRRLKILLFAGYPGAAKEIGCQLRENFGAETVAEFRADMTREMKEDAAHNFRSNARTRLLVSDETGGEGRNFEFAGALVHYDQPWQVTRIEQRIGRIDRIGRTKYQKDVLSIVVCASETMEDALVSCYEQGFRVYHESISGLEFSLREQETLLVEEAVKEGVDGLSSLAGSIRQTAEAERARDEHEALLDWASYQESRVQRYLAVRTKPEIELKLEAAFTGYFQQLAKTSAAIRYSDARTADGLWRFNLDALQVSNVLPLELGGTVVGTFRREVAQQRLDLHFLQVGNPLFESLTRASLFHPFGRTYAIQCKAPGMEPWLGFEFVFSARPDLSVLKGRQDLINIVSPAFWFAPIHVFVSSEGSIEADSQKLRNLRQSLTKQNKDVVWVHLWKERETALDAVFAPEEWAVRVHEFAARAEEATRKTLHERVVSTVTDQCKRWESLLRQQREKGTKTALDEAATLERLLRSIDQWDVCQESAGFLAVNHNLAGVR